MAQTEAWLPRSAVESEGIKSEAARPSSSTRSWTRVAAALTLALGLSSSSEARAQRLAVSGVRSALWQLAAPAAAAQPAPAAPTAQPAPGAAPAPPGAAAPESAAELSIASWAGEATTTSLAELLARTIATSPELSSAKLDYEIAEGRIDEAAAIDSWELAANLGTSLLSGPDTTQIQADATLGRLLPTGATVSVGAAVAYSHEEERATPSAVLGGTVWQQSLTASLTQPLFRGRGRAITYAGVRRAELVRDATRLSRDAAAISIVQGVVAAYWDLVLAEQEVAIAQASLELAEERLRLTRAGIRGGKVADAEALAVEQAIATRTEEVLAAELAVVDRSIALRRQAGMPLGNGALTLRVDAAVGPSERSWQLATLLEPAYAASPELARLAVDKKTVEIDVEVTENGILPQLDLALSLSPIGRDNDPDGAFTNLVTVEDYRIDASLRLQHTLGARAAKGRLRSARGQLEKVKVSEADVRQQLAQSLARALGQLELARRRAQLADKAISLSLRNIEVELTRFGLGKSTNFDVLQRQDELKQARQRQARALIDWRKSEAAVMAITGELLPFFGISFDK